MPVSFQDVTYIYHRKSPLEFEALHKICLGIEEGSFTALIGRTGCGKSTLVQHLNALLNPTFGSVVIDEFVNDASKKKRTKRLKPLRERVGLVFQFPEYQLFEDTVEKDVAFGPKNFGKKPEEALEAAHKALKAVGLDESFYQRSPFELSGGEKRRVAIAGVLAYAPKYLIVDEPTAGLDPEGALEMMGLFQKIHEQGTTVLLVTHDMNLVLSYCDKAIVMADGRIEKIIAPKELFQEDIESYSLETPLLYRFARDLNAKGMHLDFSSIKDVGSLAKQIKAQRGKKE